MAFSIQQINRLFTDSYADESGLVIVRNYQILLTPESNPTDFTENDVIGATDGATTIPNDNETVVFNTTIFTMRGRRVSWDPKDPRRILVQCTYSANAASPGGGTLPYAIDVRCESVRFTETAFRDLDGKRYVSTVGEMLDPLPEKIVRGRKITLSFLARNFNVKALEDAEDAINSDTMVFNIRTFRGPTYQRTFQPKTLILDEVSWGTQTAPGALSVLSVSVSLIYKSVMEDGTEYGWTYRAPNRGYYYNKNPGGSLDLGLIYKDGQPAVSPQYLADDGSVITDPEASPFMLSFKNNKLVPFSPLLSQLNG